MVSISRDNKSKLTDAICFIHLNYGDWGSRHLIDVTGELAPQLIIERPNNLSVGATVEIQLQCDAPWDQDNSEEDDSNYIVLSSGIATQSDGLDYAMLLGSLVVVFGTMALLGMIRPDSGPKQVERRQRVRKRTKASTHKTSMAPEDEDEDIQFEDDSEQMQIMPEPEIAVEEEIDEEPGAILDEFESRLQRLRDRRGGN